MGKRTENDFDGLKYFKITTCDAHVSWICAVYKIRKISIKEFKIKPS